MTHAYVSYQVRIVFAYDVVNVLIDNVCMVYFYVMRIRFVTCMYNLK